MKIFGMEITVRKQLDTIGPPSTILNNGQNSYLYERGWFPIVQEPFAGAWQRNKPLIMGNPLQNGTLYRCVTMIAADIAKMRLKLMQPSGQAGAQVWTETTSSAFTPVMSKPNHYQTRIQFFESWMISKLRRGNAYILKEYDQRPVVRAMYVLNPDRVKPLRATDGSIFYELNTDYLAGIPTDRVIVTPDDLMHDRMNCLFDPLVGMPPLFCATAPAIASLGMQEFSAQFFNNAARPGGLLSAPGEIPPEDIERLKKMMDQGYSEENRGKTAVMGNGLKFEPMQQNAVDSQLIEQLKHTDESIAAAFGIPGYMVGVKDPPNYNNAELLDLQYYKQVLQSPIEHLELILSEGLYLVDAGYRAEFDLTGLFRMDSQTQINTLAVAVDKGILTHNEARLLMGYGPQPGGDKLMAQQQMFTLEALTARDAAPAIPAATPAPTAKPSAQQQSQLDQRALLDALRKEFGRAAAA